MPDVVVISERTLVGLDITPVGMAVGTRGGNGILFEGEPDLALTGLTAEIAFATHRFANSKSMSAWHGWSSGHQQAKFFPRNSLSSSRKVFFPISIHVRYILTHIRKPNDESGLNGLPHLLGRPT